MSTAPCNDLARRQLREIFDAAVQAVAPDGAVQRHVSLKGETLCVDGAAYPLEGRRVFVLGAGKGAAPMAQALESLLGDRITRGLVVVKYDHVLPLKHIALVEAAHPVPDEAGMRGTKAMLDIAQEAGENDLVICLFTGGASALTPALAPGIELKELRATTNLLLQCGASIHEINALRKHLSVFSGGQLARAIAPATVLTLIVSDVVGDDLDVIASGPTAPDPSTFALCHDIVRKYDLEQRLPQSVRTRLAEGLEGRVEESPKQDDPLFSRVRNVLIATNRQALEAAAHKAQSLGFVPRILCDNMTGEARELAVELARQALLEARSLPEGASPLCLLAGGESTVTLRGPGLGGRNQEMALAAALELEGKPLVAALFAGTDGTDGPTNAAGGFALCHSATAIRAHADPKALLEGNNSHEALRLSGDLLVTGPTLTNVMDVAILLACPENNTAANN